MTTKLEKAINHEEIQIQTPKAVIRGDLCMPHETQGVVIFAHGAGSSRFSPRNNYVAEILQKAGFATLLMDLRSEDEDQLDMFARKLRFDIPLLAGRIDSATEWVQQDERTAGLPIGYFGASTGAAAALVASVQRPETIRAIVSRGGRPDLADNILAEVKSPTLLIVGSIDETVLEQNQMAHKKLNSEKKLVTIPGATHLFEEPGKLDEVAEHAKAWFQQYLIHNSQENRKDCPGPFIDSYSFGHMTVDGEQYDEDLIIFPDRIKAHWWRDNGHTLRTTDLQDVIEYKPELLVVGTGASGRMQTELQTRDTLGQEGIRYVEAQTGDARKIFNEEMEKGTRVVGAFHLTC